MLDPFLGSGTTSLAAMNLGRNSIGYEINKEFEPVIREKLQDNLFGIENSIEFLEDDERFYNYSSLPYLFHDPHKMDKKIDIKNLQFGSKIDKTECKKDDLFIVKQVISPTTLLLNTGLTIKLLGILEKQETTQQAIKYLQGVFKKRKVFLKYDTIKYDSNDNLLCYVYLDNKTFVNNHLARTGFVSIDTSIDYKYKKKFLESLNNG